MIPFLLCCFNKEIPLKLQILMIVSWYFESKLFGGRSYETYEVSIDINVLLNIYS